MQLKNKFDRPKTFNFDKIFTIQKSFVKFIAIIT